MADTTQTTMYQVGTKVGTVARNLRDTLSALDTRATALETKAANYQSKPNAEFYRYAPRISLNTTVRAKVGEVALSVHVYIAKTQTDIYFHIEPFMSYLVGQVAPGVWVSPTLKLEIGDIGRVMAYGKFFDKNGKYTAPYAMGLVFLDIADAAADNIPPEDGVAYYQTNNVGFLHSEHPMVRSEGNTTTQVAASASEITDYWVPLSSALYCCNSESATAMDATENGKWAADLMKCWIEHYGVESGDAARPLYDAWRTYILQTCRTFDPDFTLVFSNRCGTPFTALTGAPKHF